MENRRSKPKVSISKDQIKFALIVLGVIGLLIGVIWYDSFQAKNLVLGLKDGESALSSMTQYQNLPWNSSEYKLRAVVFCGGHKIFIENGTKFPSSDFNGCGFSLAEDIEIEIRADIWEGNGFFTFIPRE